MQPNWATWLEEIHTAVLFFFCFVLFSQLFSSVHEIYPNILTYSEGDKDSHSVNTSEAWIDNIHGKSSLISQTWEELSGHLQSVTLVNLCWFE